MEGKKGWLHCVGHGEAHKQQLPLRKMRIEIKNEEDDLLWKDDNRSGNPLWCMMYGPESFKNGRQNVFEEM